MKVLGVSGKYDGKYICEVTHSELEQFFNLYYGKLKALSTGNVIDLGKGYDFASDAKEAMRATADLIEKNKKVIESILNGIQVIGRMECNEQSKKS